MNNNKDKKSHTINLMCNLIKFNQPNANGNIISKNAVNIKDLEKMKMSGAIMDHEINDNGIKIIKKFDLRSVSFKIM